MRPHRTLPTILFVLLAAALLVSPVALAEDGRVAGDGAQVMLELLLAPPSCSASTPTEAAAAWNATEMPGRCDDSCEYCYHDEECPGSECGNGWQCIDLR